MATIIIYIYDRTTTRIAVHLLQYHRCSSFTPTPTARPLRQTQLLHSRMPSCSCHTRLVDKVPVHRRTCPFLITYLFSRFDYCLSLELAKYYAPVQYLHAADPAAVLTRLLSTNASYIVLSASILLLLVFQWLRWDLCIQTKFADEFITSKVVSIIFTGLTLLPPLSQPTSS